MQPPTPHHFERAAGRPLGSSRLASALFAVFALATPRSASAQTAPPAFTPAPVAQIAPPQADDMVVLGDDTQVHGRVLQVRRGELVVIRDTAGRERTFPWAYVRRVVFALQSGPAAAPLPLPSGPVAGSGAEPLGPDSSRARLAHNLLIGGIVGLSFGYVMAAIGGAAGLGVGASQQEGHGTSCFKAAAYTFIPFAGPLVAASKYPRHTVMGDNGFVRCGGAAAGVTAFGVLDTLVQVGSAGVLIGGLVLGSSEPAPAPVRSGSWVVRPGVAGAPAGLTASFTWL